MEFQDFPGIQGESPCTGLYAGWWLSLPPTPLKNHGVSSSVGMMTFPTVSGEIPNMFQTTNQSLYVIYLYIYISYIPSNIPTMVGYKSHILWKNQSHVPCFLSLSATYFMPRWQNESQNGLVGFSSFLHRTMVLVYLSTM